MLSSHEKIVLPSSVTKNQKAPPWRIDTDAWISWGSRTGAYGDIRYQYEVKFQIGNPNDFPVYFDTIVLRFHRSDINYSNSTALTNPDYS
jgi:hypothetical protein